MTRKVTPLALVFLLFALVMVNTSSASVADFYVLPDVGGQVYLLSRSAVGVKSTAISKCQANSAELTLFESNQEYADVTSYLDVFLKSTNGTAVININGIWIDFKEDLIWPHCRWNREQVSTSVWATGQPSSSCQNLNIFAERCGIIAVNDRLMTSGLYDKSCGESFWALCKVKNECALNETNKCEHKCTDEVNGYTCSCQPGYVLTDDGYTCMDKDECNGTASPRPCKQLCRNNNGSYTCECHHGYTLNNDRISCADVNECNTSDHMCEHVCNNVNGSYNCSCNPGFYLGNDSKQCFDFNECNTSKPCDQICNNVNGSYNCSCHSGYELGNDSKSCFDIDECNTGYHMCGGICNNVNGSYNCSCHSGFELGNDSKSCLDVDECNESKPCDHICNNVNGTYNCTCKSGFLLTSDGRSCVDINECNSTSHVCNHTCNNTEGSYECTCKDGYKLSSDLVTCRDINEFDNMSVNCERNCTINGSSVTSTCDQGFVLDINDNKTCHDIDECSTQPCNHTCHNTPGTFTCSCHLGFTLDDDLVTCRQDESYHQLCPCQCSDLTRYNPVSLLVRKEMAETRRHLKLSKTHLLSFRLSKGCADDSRVSARAIGCSGCLIAVVFLSFFLTPDLMTACRVIMNYLKHMMAKEVRDRL